MATNKASQICGISLALGTLILVACGGETTENVTNISQMGMDVVSSVGDLPKCSADNEGELAFVKGETSARICVDGKWFATKESVSDTVVLAGDTVLVSKIDTLVLAGDTVFLAGGKDTVLVSKIDTLFIEGSDLSCETKPLADSSGLKILCNGDSIGVVLNGAAGKDGEPGEKGEDGVGKDGVGCSLAQAGTKITITCGENSATIDMGEGGGIAVDTAALDSEKIAISLDEVSGVTQKGPFLSGSKVLVREMEDGRTLTQTGNSFNGKILNDKGEFKINARMLVSQYVMLEATGYYRNEVTGENSNSPLTLFGITDVTTRNIVNINLLTHLEYERVIYLVTKKKMKVLEAKKQAQQEVFGLLGINSTGFSNSEDLNIAGSSDEDGALLAFSILFQGDRSVSQLTELLTRVSTDMEKDGVWDNSTAKMGIAEWAADADSSGKLAQIRTNVKNWNLSTMVPKFEPFVRHFWYKEYGLGDCTESRINEVAAATAGKRAGTKTRYICKDTDGLGDMRWVIANDFEKDSYLWNDTTDGALKNGDVTGKKYVFDKTGSYNGAKGWRLAVAVENVYGGCVDSLFAKIRSYRGANEAGYYLCQASTRTWTLVNSNLMIDTQGWAEGDDGFSKWGDSIGVVSGGSRICYVYDTSATYNGWRTGNNNDCTLELGGCTKGRAGVMSVSEKDGNYYNCMNNVWNLVSDEVKRNTYGWDCKDTNAGEMKLGKVDDIYFVCNTNAWRKASTDEERACRVAGVCRLCTEGMQGLAEERDGEMYVCDKKNWRKFNCAEKKKDPCTENDSSLVEACETVGTFKIDYVCSDDHWHAVQHPFEYTLEAWKAKREAFNTAAVEAKVNSDSMITDPRDGNTYRTVVINGMRVFAENLRYADSVVSLNLKGQTRCYNNESKNCEIGGRYYTWTAAVNLNSRWQGASTSGLIAEQHRGICPEGWHIPTSSEWSALFGGVGYAAQQAIGNVGWPNATNASGFTALPAGYYRDGSFSAVGSFAFFWSATDLGYGDANSWYMKEGYANEEGDANHYRSYKSEGNSVRCIQDTPAELD